MIRPGSIASSATVDDSTLYLNIPASVPGGVNASQTAEAQNLPVVPFSDENNSRIDFVVQGNSFTGSDRSHGTLVVHTNQASNLTESCIVSGSYPETFAEVTVSVSTADQEPRTDSRMAITSASMTKPLMPKMPVNMGSLGQAVSSIGLISKPLEVPEIRTDVSPLTDAPNGVVTTLIVFETEAQSSEVSSMSTTDSSVIPLLGPTPDIAVLSSVQRGNGLPLGAVVGISFAVLFVVLCLGHLYYGR
ncbi:hypothetical protein BV898_07536 [Hypsibius exemplaris]|uniref:Uncharacterized protein n=1 Tax=Hypsibius exemplaris TaxID=2072580 RepID=A0A1W0WT60_HYPEX|nr:hypothetical protein BV898_07536 [Hypsibius exemplaris]